MMTEESGEIVDWSNIRREFESLLIALGELTDHTSSMPGDEQYDHVTLPAWKKLCDLEKNLRAKVPRDENCWPQWFKQAMSEFELEGGSPHEMQCAILKALQRPTRGQT